MARFSANSLIRRGLSSIMVRLLDLPTRYGFHLLIAAQLGVLQAGQFYIVFSIVVAFAGFGRLGIDKALVRQIARDVATQNYGGVRPTIRRAYLMVLAESGLIAGALALLSLPLAQYVLNKPELGVPLVLAALSIIPQNLGVVAGGALAGLQRIGQSQMIYSWLWPALFCITALGIGIDVNSALVLMAVSFAAAALIGGILLLVALRSLPKGEAGATPAPMFRLGLTLFTSELTQLLLTSAPAIALGILASTETVGLFSLAWRISLIVNVLINGIAAMAAPKFAELYAQDRRDALSQTATQSVGIVLALAIVPLLVMLVLPSTLLGVFGPGFGQGALILQILAIGQLAAVCFTGMPELLGMTAHANSLQRINALSLVVLLVGMAVAIPLWNGEGAALATALAIIVNGGMAAWAAHRHLGISPLRALLQAARKRQP